MEDSACVQNADIIVAPPNDEPQWNYRRVSAGLVKSVSTGSRLEACTNVERS